MARTWSGFATTWCCCPGYSSGRSYGLQLASALHGLPETQREAIELHHLHGMSLAETAIALNRSEAAVAGLLRRGLSKLRQLLDERHSIG